MGKGLGEGIRSFKKGLNEDAVDPPAKPPEEKQLPENRSSLTGAAWLGKSERKRPVALTGLFAFVLRAARRLRRAREARVSASRFGALQLGALARELNHRRQDAQADDGKDHQVEALLHHLEIAEHVTRGG